MSVAAPPKHTCDTCGRIEPRAKKTEIGGLCRRCYQRDDSRFENCGQCGKRKVPNKRLPDGTVLCNHCARPKRRCAGCGKIDHVKRTTESGPLCQRCYTAPTKPCGVCGTVTTIAVRGRDGAPDTCKRCTTGPIATCTMCREDRHVHVTWPAGPTCQACYNRTLRNPHPCDSCSNTAVLIGRRDESMICGPCAGSTFDYTCQQCSTAGEQHLTGLCMRCSAEQMITEALEQGHSPLNGALAQIPTALAERGDARSTVRWLSKARTRAMLAAVAANAGAHELTHADVDACETNARHHLRATLVDLELLPERDEPIERLETWISDFTRTLPAEHARLIDTYARWSVLRSARRRQARYGTFTLFAGEASRERIRSAARLLAHLLESGRSISELDQTTFDLWCDGNVNRTRAIAGFIKWLTSHQLVEGVSTPPIPKAQVRDIGEENEQRERITTLLTEPNELELSTRVAGLLILLYGARITQINCLTTEDVWVDLDSGRVGITMPRAQQLILPAGLARMVTELAAEVRTERSRIRGKETVHYLFPGGRRGEPIHPRTLGMKLKAAGISPRVHRNHAMLALAEDLPAAVISAQFGISASAAVGWGALSQRNQSDYVLARMPRDSQNVENQLQTASNRRHHG